MARKYNTKTQKPSRNPFEVVGDAASGAYSPRTKPKARPVITRTKPSGSAVRAAKTARSRAVAASDSVGARGLQRSPALRAKKRKTLA